jgi:pyruvate dehydrogenase E1 component alpha subunit
VAEPLRIIGNGSDIPDGRVPDGLADKDLIELYRWLVLLRTFDERAVALQRQGRIGTYPLYWGEEATQAGPLYACDEADWAFPTYRQNAIVVLRGAPASVILGWCRGYGGPAGFYNPHRYRVAPICVPIATHLPHAVGLAWAAKIRGEQTASLAWIGDGGTSEGDFHEAMNFAGVFKTATVFFCVNNQWAISTPITRQMATKTVAEKATGYAMPAARVDGFDPLACYSATRDALVRAREGAGPSFIEAFCYRIAAHGTADDPKLYRDEAEVERWRPLEPLNRTRAFLERIGVLDDARDEEIGHEAKRRVAEAVQELESLDPPDASVLFDHVYASGRPKVYEEAMAELRSVGRGGGS